MWCDLHDHHPRSHTHRPIVLVYRLYSFCCSCVPFYVTYVCKYCTCKMFSNTVFTIVPPICFFWLTYHCLSWYFPPLFVQFVLVCISAQFLPMSPLKCQCIIAYVCGLWRKDSALYLCALYIYSLILYVLCLPCYLAVDVVYLRVVSIALTAPTPIVPLPSSVSIV